MKVTNVVSIAKADAAHMSMPVVSFENDGVTTSHCDKVARPHTKANPATQPAHCFPVTLSSWSAQHCAKLRRPFVPGAASFRALLGGFAACS
jgi:hypothetical protein